jgi:hypothetical protein
MIEIVIMPILICISIFEIRSQLYTSNRLCCKGTLKHNRLQKYFRIYLLGWKDKTIFALKLDNDLVISSLKKNL